MNRSERKARDLYAMYLRVWTGDDPLPETGSLDERKRDIAREVAEMLAAPTLDAAVALWWVIDDDDLPELRRDVARLRRIGKGKVKR